MNPYAQWIRKLGRPAVFAHRGASRAAPENSLAALKLAAEMGADAVEFDVQPCATGELMVFHDETLDRCTGAIGKITETPLSKLRELTLDRVATARGVPQRGERIPLLAEWLAAMPPSLFINLEVKGDVWSDTQHAAACALAIQGAGFASRTVISGFHPGALLRAHRFDSHLPLATLFEDDRRWRVALGLGVAAGARAIHPPASLVTKSRVTRWHRLGFVVSTWTVDEPDEAKRVLDAGVDALFSNRPDVMRPIVEQYRRGR